MTIVEIGKRLYPVPQKWNELTGRQLIDALVILHSGMDVDTARLHLFRTITATTWWRLWWLGVKEFDDLLYLVDWMLTDNTLTKNILPVYREMYGPADAFNNLIISEFIFTEQHYTIFKNAETSEPDRLAALNSLVGILYRPAKPGYDMRRNESGDIREAFNDNLTGFYSDFVALWPFAVKQAIAFWYAGCRDQLIKDFPKPFTPDPDSEGESVYGLWDILFSIAEKNVLGDFARVEGQLLKTVLMVLTKTMADAERIEKLNKPGA